MTYIKFINCESLDVFNSNLESGKITDTCIVFIEEPKQIWTHGQFYPCPYTKEEINSIASSGVDKEKIESLLTGTITSHSHPINNISDLNSGWDSILKAAPSSYVTRHPSISEVTNKQNLAIKVNSGTTEGTDLYTYNATSAKTLDIKAGSNVTLTPRSGTLTVSAKDTTYGVASSSSNGLMSSSDKSKLDGIESGAQVNKVTSVAGKTGAVTLSKSDVGLGNVTNESKATMFTNAALTGTPTAPTASTSTNNTQIATTAFVQSVVNDKIAASDAMIYKGTIGSSGATITALPTTHKTGWTYKVSTAGTYAGQKCEVGDMIIALVDRSGSGNTNSDWTVVQSNLDGAVTGPSGSTDAHVATFNGSTGKIIKDSGFTIGKSVPSDAKFTDTVYTHPTTSGNKHIPSGGSSGQILRWSADGTAVWGNDNNTTYSQATSSTLGLVKIGYAENGRNYPVELSNGQMFVNVPWTDNNTTYGIANNTTNGLIKPWYSHTAASTGPTTGSNSTAVTVNGISTTSGRYYALEMDNAGRGFVNVPWVNTTYGVASSSSNGLMSSSDKSKLDGITASADSVSFSRSLSSGTKVGTITINGTGTDIYCQTNTDTHYTTHLYACSNDGTSNESTTNGGTYLRIFDNTTARSSIKLAGSGATSVSSDSNGNITITSTNTTYGLVGAKDSTGLVKNGSSVTSASGYTACPIISGIPYYKSASTSLSDLGITATATELNYCDGVTSNIQTQLNGKAASSHTHPISQISDLNSSWDALLKAAPSSYVTRHPSISEVTSKQNLVLKVNSGSNEGISLYTYNATSAKTLDIKAGNNVILTAGVGTLTIESKDTTYRLVDAKESIGLVKNGSSVTSSMGCTPCPIIAGIPYYKSSTLSDLGIISTATELNYCHRVTSNIQDQIDGKLSLSGGTVNGNIITNKLLAGISESDANKYAGDNSYYHLAVGYKDAGTGPGILMYRPNNTKQTQIVFSTGSGDHVMLGLDKGHDDLLLSNVKGGLKFESKGNFTYNNNTVYHSGNSEVYDINSANLESYSTERYYPVCVASNNTAFPYMDISISSTSGSASLPLNNNLRFYVRSGGWSDMGRRLNVVDYNRYSTNEVTIHSIYLGEQSGHCVVYLRGGVNYSIRSLGSNKFVSTGDTLNLEGEVYPVLNLDGNAVSGGVSNAYRAWIYETGITKQDANYANYAGYIERERGANSVSTLTDLPINKATIIATLASATTISVQSGLQVGESITVICNPTASFTQPIPTSGSFRSLDGDSLSVTNGKHFEINIYCIADNDYSISCKSSL